MDPEAEDSPRPNAQVATQNKTGQFVAPRKLTQRQEDLATLLAAGVPVGMAGRLTGYVGGTGDASRASATPAVRARVLELQRRKLQRGAVLATKLIMDLITGEVEAPAATRLDAAKYVHKSVGLDSSEQKANENRDTRTMTMAELEAVAAAFVARTAPIRHGDDAQPIDIIEHTTT